MWAWIFCWVFCATGTFDLQSMKQIFYHCATASWWLNCSSIHLVPSWDFPTVSAAIGRWIFRPYLVVTCRDFPAVSAVTGSRIFWPYLVVSASFDRFWDIFKSLYDEHFPEISVKFNKNKHKINGYMTPELLEMHHMKLYLHKKPLKLKLHRILICTNCIGIITTLHLGLVSKNTMLKICKKYKKS